MKIPNLALPARKARISLARIVSEDSQPSRRMYRYPPKSSKDS